MNMDKKGQAAGVFAAIPQGVIYLVVAIVVLSMGGLLLTNLSTQGGFVAGSAAANATNFGLATVQTISSFVPTLGLIFVFIVVIGAIVGMLYLRSR